MYTGTNYKAKKGNRAFRTFLSVMLCVALVITMVPFAPGGNWTASAAGSSSGGGGTAVGLTAEQPVFLVTGDGVIKDGTTAGKYTSENVGFEKSYTLQDLKDLADADTNASDPSDNQYLYSALNTSGTKSFHLAEGVRIGALLDAAGVTPSDQATQKIWLISKGNYPIYFDPDKVTVGDADDKSRTQGYDKARYYYPGLASGDDTVAESVPSIIAWASTEGETPPETVTSHTNNALRSVIGQLAINDYNNPLFNGKSSDPVSTLRVGNALTEVALTVDDKAYTRAQILMMPRAEYTFTYEDSNNTQITDMVRGVPLSELLGDVETSYIVTFNTTDGYKADATGMTVAELISNSYILAYEKNDPETNEWKGIYATAKKDSSKYGYFTLYGADENGKPAKMVNSITTARATSDFKHIDNGGLSGSAPYNLDALTGATVTVEGPGVSATTPLRVKDLEKTNKANIYRGDYTNGANVEFTYEGINLLSIIDGKVNSNVKKQDENIYIVFKNRERKNIAHISYSNIKKASEAGNPIILAYGVSNGTKTAPFVFNNQTGLISELGNDDGPVRLVYNPDVFELDFNTDTDLGSGAFKSVAYIYVEQGAGRPGYKHSEASSAAYDNVLNTEFFVTFTGSGLGREVNYTVEELEKMVEYNEDDKPKADGMGYRALYGLSNTTYWYVNEYEGVKLWDLLKTMGVSENDAQDIDKKNTLVSMSAWDNYQTTAQFTYEQLANPDLFYFYEKSPLDIGTDRPTKEQLANKEYQPTYTEEESENWESDDNGYPVKKGYPVVLAYGVNGYPYVRNSKLDGYSGGLGNDGGPLKVIFGKTDDMNRSNPDALENYAYFYNNGSNQLQRVQEIYVGDNKRYSTHFDNPATAYQDMKDIPNALTVEIIQVNGSKNTKTYTLAELESVLYGSSKRDRDLAGSQEKGYYAYKYYNSDLLDDLFEGVNLWHLLSEDIGLQGTLGDVSFYSGETRAAFMTLTDLQQKGYNSLRNTEDLGMMVAFAKNGYPLVSDRDAQGYVNKDSATGKDIQNRDGPLMLIRGQTETERSMGAVTVSGDMPVSIKNLTKIVVNLEADPYAHTGNDYEAYGETAVAFSGAIASEEGKILTVSDLEKLQKHMVTDSYTIGGVSHKYRGLDLKALLNDNKVIGASSLLSEVTISNGTDETTISVVDLNNAAKKIILAYGIAGSEGANPVARPLVPDVESTGYDDDYENINGPLYLVIDEDNGDKCIAGVTSINVTAAALDGWTHSAGNYLQYTNFELEISGAGLTQSKTYTVAELEAMVNLANRDLYNVGGDAYVEGIDLYKLLQNIGFANGKDTSSFTAYATDGYGQSFVGAQLQNGINGKPILIGYAVGQDATTGLPLVDGDPNNGTAGVGYDPVQGNAYGPLRLFVNDNAGWCVKWLKKIVVDESGATTPTSDFTIKGLNTNLDYTISNLKNSGATVTERSYQYTSSKVLKTDTAKGIYLADLLALAGIKDDDTKITINATDGYETSETSYQNIALSQVRAQEYMIAYDVKEDGQTGFSKVADKDKAGVTASVRIYRNTGDTSSWRNRVTNVRGITVAVTPFTVYESGGAEGFPFAGVRSIKFDSAEGLWAGTYGGGLAYKAANASKFTVYNTSSAPELKTDVVSAVAVDKSNGVWFSQNASYTESGQNRGIGYLKNNSIIWYRASDDPETIPDDYVQTIQIDDQGNVWFGSFGGLTKYDPTAKTWKTWTKADGLPATSVNTITFDGSGGLWIGCYPDGGGMSSDDLFTGGYAHMMANGEIDFVQPYIGEFNEELGWSLLADVWVRDIALDKNGAAWVVRSGSTVGYSTIVGGRLDKVVKTESGYTVKSYTGYELLGGNISTGSEVRTIAIDRNNGVWLGTTLDGVLLAHNLDKDSRTVEKVYCTKTSAWSGNAFDNIFAIKLVEKSPYLEATLYVGSAGGLAYKTVNTPVVIPGGGSGSGESASIGDATASTADLSVTGAVEKPGYFTIAGLKASSSGGITRTYHGLNTYKNPETGEGNDPQEFTYEGVYMETLLKDIMTLKSSAQSITVRSADGYYKNFNLKADEKHAAYWVDRDGNKMMLAWKGDGTEKGLRLIIGQSDAKDANQPLWIREVASIEVKEKGTVSGSGSANSWQAEGTTEKSLTETVTATVKVDTTVKDGVATGTVSASDVTKAIEQAKKDAKGDDPKILLLIDATTGNGGITGEDITLPKSVIDELLKEDNVTAIVKTDLGEVSIDTTTLKELATDGSRDLVVKMEQAETPANLDAAGREMIGDNPFMDIKLLWGGKEITDFNDLWVKIGLNHESKTGQSNQKLVLQRIDTDGTTSVIKLSACDADGKNMKGALRHFSLYAVGYNDVTFADIANHWAKSNIEFLAAREIVNGKAPNVFDPNGSVTRAEFLKMLAESIDDVDIKGAKNAGFSDVAASAWYADYVNWGVANGIVNGYPEGTFKPNNKVTREQMAVMLVNFIKYAKTNLDTVNKLTAFEDQDSISSYATSAVAQMQQCGMISGYPDGSFKPQGTATRAEAASMIERYIEAFL